MRNDTSPLLTYLNAGVILLALIFGFWAKYDMAADAPAAKPAHGIGKSLERRDEAVLPPAQALTPLLSALFSGLLSALFAGLMTHRVIVSDKQRSWSA